MIAREWKNGGRLVVLGILFSFLIVAVLGGATLYILTRDFEPLEFHQPSEVTPNTVTVGGTIEVTLYPCNSHGQPLVGSFTLWAQATDGTSEEVQLGGGSLLISPGCHPKVRNISLAAGVTPGEWRLVGSVLVLDGGRFQQETIDSGLFWVTPKGP